MKRKTSKILGLLLAVLMVMSLLPMTAFAAEAPAGTLIQGFYFETDPAAEGWTFVDADGDTRSWSWVSSNADRAYEGNGFIQSLYSNTNVDNWAISPAVDLSAYTAEDSIQLSLYERSDGSTFVERFQIWAGTSTDREQMTCITGQNSIIAPFQYTRYTADLSGFVGEETVYIAIRHCDSYDTLHLMVDAVEVRSQKAVTPVTAYDLWVAGTQVTSDNAADLSVIEGVTVGEGGEASYDASSNTLTLNGATITGPNSERIGAYSSSEADGGIVYSGTDDFTINVIGGTSTVTGGDTARDLSAGLFIGHPEDVYNYYTSDAILQCNIGINISEGATLTLNGGVPTAAYYPTSDGIRMNSIGQLTISDAGTLNANGGSTDYSYGISTIGGLVINSTGTVNATGADNTTASYGINEGSYYMVADRSLTISGSGTVNATGGTAEQFSAGIYAYSRNGVLIDAADGKINATGKAVTAYASPDDGSYGIFSYNTIEVRDGTVKAVAADVGAAGDISAGLFTSYDSSAAITISGGTVEATAGTAPAPNEVTTVNSAGIYSAGAVAISGDSTDITAEGLLAGIYAKAADIDVSGGTVTATGIGDTTITDHGYNGIGIRADEPGKITFSGENTVVSAKGIKTSVFAWAGITIDSPLEIVLPVGGKMGFGNLKIVNSDATNATDVLIKTPDSAPTEYPLWICGTQVTSANAADLTKIKSAVPSYPDEITGVSQMEGTSDCSASYDPATNTLTLNNVLIENRTGNDSGPVYAVNYTGEDDFTIKATGENIIQVNALSKGDSSGLVIGSTDGLSGEEKNPKVTITVAEDGSLRCTGGTAQEDSSSSYGIVNRGEGMLTINGPGTLTASGSLGTKSVFGIYSTGDLKISDGTVNVDINEPRGTCVGIDSANSIEITGGSVTTMVKSTPNNAGYGIRANNAITISGGTVVAAGSTSALSKAPTLNGVTAGGSANLDGTGAVAYVAEDNDSYKWFQAPFTVPVTTYPLYIAGTQVTGDNATDILGDGKVSYDATTNTLTLNGVTIDGGSENTNYYGWGINYRGTDDFKIVANGTNTVKDDHYRIYASYGIVIGEPSPVAYSTAAVNVTITVSDGASLTVSGGNINQSEDYSGSWGIYNKGTGSLIINGSGVLIAEAKDNSRKSIGIVAQNVTIDSSCSVTAAGGNSGNSMSAGIYCGNLNVPQSFTGSVTATAGNALGASYSTGTFGIRTTGDCAIGGGSVTAASGFKTGSTGSSENAVGIFGENSLTISGGATVIATGDGHGLWCYQGTTSVDASSVTAIGGNFAVNGLNLTNVTAVGSTRQDGGDPEEYDSSANNTYKYVKTTPVATVATPVLPAAGKFTDSKTIEISCETEGAAIYYTTDGSEPALNSTEYTEPFMISETTTVKAIAILDEQSSEVASATYTKSSGGGGGGGPAIYPVEAPVAENGTVTVSPAAASKGTTVTVTPKPDEGYEVDKVTVTDKDGNEIPVTDNGDGTYSFTMPSGKVTVNVTFKEIDHSAVCPSKDFTDVDPDAWYHEAVDYVVENGLMVGTADDKFDPNGTTTRAMIVTILYRLEGKPAVSGTSPFDDVASGQWYTDAVIWASENGIVSGYGDGKFGPTDDITREQFATILYRYAQYKGYDVSVGEDTNVLSYNDAFDVSDWAMPAIQWACGTGLMQGDNQGNLLPGDSATRAQVATLIMRFIENVK